MANQKLTGVDDDTKVLEINSYVRGYHAYMDTWNPALGQEGILKPEQSNNKDKHKVVNLKDEAIVGHVPYNSAPRFSQFLRRKVNKAFALVTGEKENREAGYGLEIPSVYRLYGGKVYNDKMKELFDRLERPWTRMDTHILL